ncbi:MAG: hypothetical protein K9H49_08705 [Bacteroidales bacterium]|nr:hypothetical protein [Bacteroidales bacterium]
MARSVFIYFFIILLGLSSCKQENQSLSTNVQWSALHAGQVPENLRKKEFNKKNLIVNPSFEQGKFYMTDTLKSSFSLPGWKKVGENVFWTNTEDVLNYFPDEASKGTHAIKIVKDKCDETDNQGEGIISDYIKVIPGNYMLRMDLRLKNIISNMDRFGTGVYDAVNIRLFYYDKNKVLIKSAAYHPEYDYEINQAFKGFSFSGNQTIEEFGWAEIVARAGNFPFEEGNIPDETRYVKVFAGLKGTGEMYIDFVRFEYTSKNFTFLEQIQPYFDTILNNSAYLVPLPQKIEKYSPLDLKLVSETGKEKLPLFILPKILNSQERILFDNLQKKLREKGLLAKNGTNFLHKYQRNSSELYPFVISFGLNDLSSGFSDRQVLQEFGNKEQSYIIKKIENGENLIFINYSDIEGLDRAINTLTQLFDEVNGIYHHYDINDYPDYTDRTAVIPYFIQDNYSKYSDWLLLLQNFGFNKFVVKTATDDLTVAQLDNLSRIWNNHFKVLQNLHPYIKTGIFFETVKLTNTQKALDTGSKFGDKELQTSLRKDADEMANMVNRMETFSPDIWIFTDRFLWEIQDRNNQNFLKLENYTAFFNETNMFWGNLSNGLKTSKETPKYLYPYFLSNAELKNKKLASNLYFENLQQSAINFDRILWTGAVEFPEFIDPSDLFNYTGKSVSLLSKHSNIRKESCVTGSYYSIYPGRALTGSLFHGFDTNLIGISPEMLNNECVLDLEKFSELNVIRLLSSLDYLWNSSAYSPSFSSWKILVMLYGKETARTLVMFNDTYYKLSATIIDLDKLGYNLRISKTGESLISELNDYWDIITVDLASHTDLLNDLSDLKNALISRYYQSARVKSRETNLKNN